MTVSLALDLANPEAAVTIRGDPMLNRRSALTVLAVSGLAFQRAMAAEPLTSSAPAAAAAIRNFFIFPVSSSLLTSFAAYLR